jgi:hypothetical protein
MQKVRKENSNSTQDLNLSMVLNSMSNRSIRICMSASEKC